MLSNKEDLLKILDKVVSLPVLVVGDIILDRYIWGRCDRISAEAPVPVVEVKRMEDRLGGAANVVRNLCNIGAKVSLCGIIGDDQEGEIVCSLLDKEGVDREGVIIDPTRPTCLKTRVIAQAQQIVRIDRETSEQANLALRQGFANVVNDHIDASKVVVISDYGKGAISDTLMQKLKQAHSEQKIGMNIRPLIVDPHPMNFEEYGQVTVAKPNRKEAELASGIRINSKEKAIEASKVLLRKWNAEMIIITLGEDGMVIVKAGTGQGIFLETVAREVFDVSGAGDTVSALFAAAIACGASPAEAGDLANIGAGIVVSEVGTAAVELESLRKEINAMSTRV